MNNLEEVFYSGYGEGLSWWLSGNANVGDTISIPGLGRSPGDGNGNPLQYSFLENPMDRGAWRSMGSQRVRHN